jgi:hypothetical protein
MSRSLKGQNGYQAGRGGTFTPSVYADWTDDFNRIMAEKNMSRNEVTEYLITEGLKSLKVGRIELEIDLNYKEIEFLKTEFGKKLINDYSKLFYGGNFQIKSPVIEEVHTGYNQSNMQQNHINNPIPINNPKDKIEHEEAIKVYTEDQSNIDEIKGLLTGMSSKKIQKNK